jgi:dTDP-4-dehydrorhamnose 3,5-epimerase
MIKDVLIKPLTKIPDERGCILPMLRSDWEDFRGFGEIYFSLVYQGIIKGWHLHKKMTLNYVVVQGMIKLVLFDPREHSETKGEIQEIFLGDMKYALVQIPPGIWNGFKGISNPHALVANCSDIPHDSSEIVRLDPFSNEIPYQWDVRHG